MPRSFVIFAEMRTGSNFLEANLESVPGVRCFGEAFNPHFVGGPNRSDLLGIDLEARQADPAPLLTRIREAEGITGFRFFHDHDPRILDALFADRDCAKILLRRDPVESYVSLRIAQQTGQWKLTDRRHARFARVRFDPDDYLERTTAAEAFRDGIERRLQDSGQAAYRLDFEDLSNVAVLNGLLAFLGAEGRLDAPDDTLKRQNPAPLSEKVENADEMAAWLARNSGRPLLSDADRRGAAVPGWIAADSLPILYQPIRSGPEAATESWLNALGGTRTGLNQKALRQWQKEQPGHVAFTVLRHPLARVHAAFCDKILATGEGAFTAIRRSLKKTYGIALPDGEGFDPDRHRAAFEGWLDFLRLNLARQTDIRVDAHWAPLTDILDGFARVRAPDRVLREETLARDLARLAGDLGLDNPRLPETDPHRQWLAAIHDPELEARVRDLFPRDFLAYGFGEWPGQAA